MFNGKVECLDDVKEHVYINISSNARGGANESKTSLTGKSAPNRYPVSSRISHKSEPPRPGGVRYLHQTSDEAASKAAESGNDE